MSREIILGALNGIRDEYITEAAAALGLLGATAPAYTKPAREHRENLLSRFFNSGWGVAVICAVVSLSVLGGIVWAGQRPTVPPGGSDMPHVSEGEPDTNTPAESEDTSSNETESVTHDSDHVHAYGEWNVIAEPTCAAEGMRKRFCACGETETEYTVALPHTWVVEPGVPPTATEPGLSEGRHCSVCGEIVSQQTTLEPTGHTDLAYVIHEDRYTCSIAGIGTCTATNIYIPSKIDGYKVTAIRDHAFMNQPLTGIHIPSTVVEIGEAAFFGCTALKEITIPRGVVRLGDSAFQYCTGLTEVTLQCHINRLPLQLFHGCSSLSEVTLPDNLTEIGMNAFGECTSLEQIRFPSALHSIGTAAFQGCTALTGVTLPEELRVLDDMAFEGCVSLTEMTLPDGMNRIGAHALSGCSNITTVTVPKGVKQAEPSAFEGMDGLTDLYFRGTEAQWSTVGYHLPAGVQVHCRISELEYTLSADGTYYIVTGLGAYDSTTVVIPDTYRDLPVREIGKSAFSAEDIITELHLGRNVDRIENCNFYLGGDLESVWVHDIEQWFRIDFSGGRCQYSHSAVLYVGGEALTHLIVPDTVTEIPNFAFTWCSTLESVTVGEQVTRIGSSAFGYCTALQTVTFNGTVEEIGDFAFSGCTALTTVTLPDTVKRIGDYSFRQCSSLRVLHIGNGVESIGEGTFMNCTSLAQILLPAPLTYIGKYAFRGCTALTDAVFAVKKTWYAKVYVTDNHLSPFGEAALANSESAAHFLTEGKEDHFWERKP